MSDPLPPATPETPPPQPLGGSTREIAAWSLYDFGNSAFTTMVVTFVYAAYFTKAMVPEPPVDDPRIATTMWSWGVSATAVAVALLSPILGAIADRGGYRKTFLFLTTVVCILATVALTFLTPGWAWAALIIFVLGNIAFEMGGVFYNAFLPDIAPPDKIGQVSGIGWASGYVGGLLVLVIALAVFILPEEPLFGLISKEAGLHVRATNMLTAVWFAVFAIPMFLYVKEDKSRVDKSVSALAIARSSLSQLKETFAEIRAYKEIMKLLAARLIYNDGLVTVFFFGGIYASQVFGFSDEELLYFGILLNLTAAIGSFGLGFLDDKLGGRATILLSLVALTICTFASLLATEKLTFWISGAFLGIFVGPNQSASRSLMGRFVPPDKENEFFGFFAFSGKATAFLGPFLLGLLTAIFDSERAGFAVVIGFFVVGGLILLTLNEEAGIKAAGREVGAPPAEG